MSAQQRNRDRKGAERAKSANTQQPIQNRARQQAAPNRDRQEAEIKPSD